MTEPQRSATIGFIAPQLIGNYFRAVLSGVYTAARRRGARLVAVQGTSRDLAARRLAMRQVQGWVVVADTAGVAELAANGAPVVTVSRRVEGCSAIMTDNAGGMRAATRHLLDLGHTRIAFVGSLANPEIAERLEGYRAALAERGVAFDERLVFPVVDEHLAGGAEAGRALLAAGVPCTAVAAATDVNAVTLMAALRQAGHRCPEDIAVVGFDDMPEAQAFDPPLTTVRQRFDEMGRAATERLLAQIADSSLAPATVLAATALVVRRSTGAADPGAAGAPAARAPLAERMLAALLYPVAPAGTAEQVWPAGAALAGLLAEGAALPGAREMVAAWDSAADLASSPEVLDATLEEFDSAAAELAGGAGAERRAHIAEVRRRVRRGLVHALSNVAARQLIYIERTIDVSNEISARLASADMAAARGLGWLAAAEVGWGCLGLWDERGAIEVAGSFPDPRDGVGEALDPADFPPLARVDPRHDVIALLRVHTPRREWGMLALATTYQERVSFVDSFRLWVALLGARLDDSTLMEEVERQSEVLHQAYTRERALSETVRDLGSPVLPIGGGALLVPLIGLIDSARAQQVIDEVLRAVGRERATDVLVDVTGVPVIDTQVAGVLIQLADMARLLGARATLIGVRPEIAQSIVGLGVDLRRLAAQSSLAAAIGSLRATPRPTGG